jgi:hypothetical protein
MVFHLGCDLVARTDFHLGCGSVALREQHLDYCLVAWTVAQSVFYLDCEFWLVSLPNPCKLNPAHGE